MSESREKPTQKVQGESRITKSGSSELYRRLLTLVLLSLIFIFCLIIPSPTEPQWKIINSLTAITVAFLASEITGFINLNIPKFVKAGGAVAVFVFVFWVNKDFTPTLDSKSFQANRIDELVQLTPKFLENIDANSDK